jgi:hypothetical protein
VRAGFRQILAAFAADLAGNDVRRNRFPDFAPETGDFVMRATLTADGTDPRLPLVICRATDLANTPPPEVVGVSVQPAATASTVFPIMIPIAHLLASITAAARPLVSEDASPVYVFVPSREVGYDSSAINLR